MSKNWNFDNTYIKLPKDFYDKKVPEKVSRPHLIYFNAKFAKELGLNYSQKDEKEIAEVFSGNKIVDGSEPLAQAYAGHQFGHFTMLGDGRAILLGEQIDPTGKRWDIQLKGSGKTAYSRGGDGRATLSAILREYIMSESLHSLKVPTSRSLAVIGTGEFVQREEMHKGAILTRVASSHIRVGTFEYVNRFLGKSKLKHFTDYVIERHYPEVKATENPVMSFFNRVMEKQVALVVNWMRVGFIHGVMNTDNCTISGKTIDYGPCAFMNSYNQNTVFSSIDKQKRYAFGNQPAITQWNLMCLAGALLPLIHEDKNIAVDLAEQALKKFPKLYEKESLAMMRKKLGLVGESDEDEKLINDLLQWMQENDIDYTNTFIALQSGKIEENEAYQNDEFKEWYQKWLANIKERSSIKEAQELMKKNNPLYIPRNHQVESALNLASKNNDFSAFDRLLKVLSNPYEYSIGAEDLQLPPKGGDENYQTFCGT